MKVYAHFDSAGNIRRLFTMDGPDGAGGMLVPAPGLMVGEIELEGVELRSDESDMERLQEIRKNYVMASPSPRLKLKKK